MVDNSTSKNDHTSNKPVPVIGCGGSNNIVVMTPKQNPIKR